MATSDTHLHDSVAHAGGESHFIVFFGGTFFVLLIILIGLRATPSPAHVFYRPDLCSVLMRLPPDEVAEAKLLFVRLNKVVPEVGLFGNSRIYSISSKHIGLEGRAFNFAIAGQSFRQTVFMIEELAKSGHLPPTLLISMDHMELGLPGEVPVTPGFLSRLRQRFYEIPTVFFSAGLKQALIHIVNSTYYEWRALMIGFNPDYVSAKLQLLEILPSQSSSPFYLKDGSIYNPRPVQSEIFDGFASHASRYPLLEADIQRLSVAAKGHRVLIYFSPLFPPLLDKVTNSPSRLAKMNDLRFQTVCAREGLTCLPSPRLSNHPQDWIDSSHPRAELLASWFREILAR